MCHVICYVSRIRVRADKGVIHVARNIFGCDEHPPYEPLYT